MFDRFKKNNREIVEPKNKDEKELEDLEESETMEEEILKDSTKHRYLYRPATN